MNDCYPKEKKLVFTEEQRPQFKKKNKQKLLVIQDYP